MQDDRKETDLPATAPPSGGVVPVSGEDWHDNDVRADIGYKHPVAAPGLSAVRAVRARLALTSRSHWAQDGDGADDR